MRVLILLPYFTLGGAETQATYLAKGLANLGHEVHAWGISSTAQTPLMDELISYGVNCFQIPRWPNLSLLTGKIRGANILHRWLALRGEIKAFGRLLPDDQFDVIIPFTPYVSIIAVCYQRKLGAKAIFWNHRGGYDDGGFPYTDLFRRKVLKSGAILVANSSMGARFLSERFKVNIKKVAVIQNAYDPQILAFDKGDRTQETKRNIPVVVHVANFFPQKDPLTLLRAINIVRNQGREMRLDFIGRFINDSDEELFHSEIRKLGLEGLVRVLGGLDREQTWRAVAGADIGALSTKSEGSPNAIIEYMMLGLPVVATSIPAIVDLVSAENRIFLTAVGDEFAMASSLIRLFDNQDLGERIGRRNRAWCQERHNPSKVVENWGHLIESMN